MSWLDEPMTNGDYMAQAVFGPVVVFVGWVLFNLVRGPR